MKKLLLGLLLICSYAIGYSQNETVPIKDSTIYKIVKNDGSEIIGTILSQDAREVLLLTKDYRQIYIPQHLIKSIVKMDNVSYNNNGEYVGEDKFATRYFITTNGLPIKKGENYVQWNLFGPDFQFAIGEDLGVGIMTSWLGSPIIGTFKKSWEINEYRHFAVGALVGTGSWSAIKWGGALPFATFSMGDRTKNIAFSGGYGAIWQPQEYITGPYTYNEVMEINGRALGSVAGMVKISSKISLVFDSFILFPGKSKTEDYTYYDYVYNQNTGQYEYQTIQGTRTLTYPGAALIMPGIRWHQSEGKAIQFGFTGLVLDGEVMPVPIPMVQWYRSL